ncbi:hypothetical protein [Fontivita pretiosa]|uniref:hypothetical protein n=1 Tax=Fontivita pretiosa TaxID=2989684 RepID=UPI003D1657AA
MIQRHDSHAQDPDHSVEPRLRATLLILVVGLLGRAIQISNGVLFPERATTPAWWLAAAFGVMLIAAFVPIPRTCTANVADNVFTASAALVVLGSCAQLLEDAPGVFLRIEEAGDYTPYLMGCAVLAMLSGVALAGEGWLRHAALLFMLIAFVLLGVWVIRNSPSPRIDVYVFQHHSAAALSRGQNPYTITFPDIYARNPEFYGPGLAAGGVVHFGYPYPPLPLLMVMPAHSMFADVRYAHLAAIALAAALIACGAGGTSPGGACIARPRMFRSAPFVGACLLLTMPRSFFIIEQSWIEPLTALLLTATVISWVRWPAIMPFVLGLLLASKQYVPAAAALAWLLVPGSHDSRRRAAMAWPMQHLALPGRGTSLWSDLLLFGIVLLKATIAAAVVTLPLALRDLDAFASSVLSLQVRQPYRPDSLSFLAWYGRGAGINWVGPGWIGFVAMAVSVGLSLWRCPRTPAGFACAFAVCYFTFFAFGKQAFANYYYLVIAAACVSIGLSGTGPSVGLPAAAAVSLPAGSSSESG